MMPMAWLQNPHCASRETAFRNGAAVEIPEFLRATPQGSIARMAANGGCVNAVGMSERRGGASSNADNHRQDRSSDLQSALSPICNRPRFDRSRHSSPGPRRAGCNPAKQQIANLRYVGGRPVFTVLIRRRAHTVDLAGGRRLARWGSSA